LTDLHHRRREHSKHRLAGSRPSDSPDYWILGGLPMSDAVKVGFVPFSSAARGTLVVFTDYT
jgi:hypothetical protein